MKKNICTLSDSYKMCHYKFYPEGTEYVYSYFEARKSATYNKTVFYGLQALIKENFEGVIVTKEKIDQAEKLIDIHLGKGVFNRSGWEYILNNCGGKLPIRIKAIPEGTPVTKDNVLMTVENTDPNCAWLTNYLETVLSHVWYTSTVSTLSREIKIMLDHYLNITADNKNILPFQLHDFGYRGTECVESAGAGGSAHLVNFMGTDTIAGIEYAMQYYGADVCAYSVHATEHSIQTALGKDGEEEVFKNLLKECPTGILSVVIDSYDYMKFIEMAGTKFKDQILNRDGKLVFRPDSGDPVSVSSDVINALGKYFGYTINSKGFKVLNPKVGMIYGDGLDYQKIRFILFQFNLEGWSTENIVFGLGGGLLQNLNRDTQFCAFKSSAQYRDGVWHTIQKEPRESSKKSKGGRLSLLNTNGVWSTVPETTVGDCLVTVFENGKLIKEYSFEEVRKNASL
jgi:nicotinamide phosphoribosyltransferase